MAGHEVKPEDVFMDEAMVEKAANEQNSHQKGEEINFSQVFEIRLAYRNILNIDNLWDYTSLTRLDLNNNMIKIIDGLDHLIHLKWLNLSFNQIKKIQGLQSLQKLDLLNLSYNRISVIENMDKLEKLTHFSIAHNLLQQLDNVRYLRQLKGLFSLNLFGNPLCEEDDYLLFIAGYLPNLTSLDSRIIHQETKNKASIKYHDDIEKIKHEELQLQQALDAEQREKAERQLHKDAFVEFLNGSYFFKSMLKDDPEAETLHCVTGVTDLLHTFEHQMVALCTQLFEIGLTEHERRKTEIKSFFSGLNQTFKFYQQEALQIVANVDQQHKERIVQLQQSSDPDVLKVNINHCNDEISKFTDRLMSLEFQMGRQFEAIIKKLDDNISEMVGNFTETVQEIFAQCRDLEDNYYLNMQKIAVETLEKVAKDDLEEDIPDDVKILFTDKDAVMDVLTTSHDNHLLKLYNRETQLITDVNAWKAATIEGIQETQFKQSRVRIQDTLRYAEYLKAQVERFQ
ncbi:dynein regulatory complex subunit 3 [Echeneis naucrates]|uniref:dynein regulatory complex subunit 3 n=1 Tax=Echeneis naucrates TaxID=173247 RepID=UPI001113E273|nr:dynein regulatory complex subunit 3 [Echeneis naucrates]